MQKKGVITVDIGSSSIRVSLFDEKLNCIDVVKKRYLAGTKPDVNAYWECVAEGMAALVQANQDVEIISICISCLVGWVVVDANGNPLTHAYTWMDQKPEQAEKFKSRMDSEEFFTRNGRRISAELAGLKLLYLKEKEPEIYEKTACLLSIKDYINYKLTGSFAMDYTSAGYTMVLNLKEKAWDEKIAEALGISLDKFPKLCGSTDIVGGITEEMAKRLGIAAGIPVAAGGPDGSVGVLGAGGVHPGTAVSVMGTSDVFFTVSQNCVLDSEQRLVTNAHVLPGVWLIGGPMGLSGGTIDWLANKLLMGQVSMNDLTEAAEKIPAGENKTVFIPSFTGERTPFWYSSMKGTVLGLDMEAGAEHLFRAVMEANCYTVRAIVDATAQSNVPMDTLYAIGGGSRNPLWLKMKASMLHQTISFQEDSEATTKGSAMLALLSVGVLTPENIVTVVSGTVEPVPEWSAAYEEPYEAYKMTIKQCAEHYTSE